MKKQESLPPKSINKLADLVGDFIRYWGFRKIHGEIWTLVYLSPSPLSGAQITQLLSVSKALVSPALKELEEEGLIFQTKSENSKTKRYQAEENVTEVIRNVLNRREKPLIKKIVDAHLQLAEQTSQANSNEASSINTDRLEKLGEMIQTAQIGLTFIAESDQMWS